MIPDHLKYYLSRLQKENYKSFYLAFLRVGISIWLLTELCLNWSSLDVLYGRSAFVLSKTNFLHRLAGGFSSISNYYMWFIIPYILVLLLNIAGIGRWITALLLFVMLYTLQRMNMLIVNGGGLMARLILLYLVFANSYQYFVLIKQKPLKEQQRKIVNLLSNLAALSIMLHLCLAYFSSGIVKILDTYWQRGEAVYYVLQMERFVGTPFNSVILQHPWIDITATYTVLLFELGFPILIWIKKLRKPLLVIGIIFHLSIYIFLMIYAFQIVFLLIYGLFLPNEKLLSFARKVKGWVWRR